MAADPMKTKASKTIEGSARNLASILTVVSIFLGLGEVAQAQEGAPASVAAL